MAAVTAMMFVGEPHGNDGGLLPYGSPILLSEGSRAAWYLRNHMQPFSFVPISPSTILDDGLLLLTARRLGWSHKDPFVDRMIKGGRIDLNHNFREFFSKKEDYTQLIDLAKKFVPEIDKKVLIVAMESSGLLDCMSDLENWGNIQVELLASKYTRHYSRWTGAYVTNGSLR